MHAVFSLRTACKYTGKNILVEGWLTNFVHVHVHVLVHDKMYVYVHVHVLVRMHVHLHDIHARMPVYVQFMCISLCLRMHICINTVFTKSYV